MAVTSKPTSARWDGVRLDLGGPAQGIEAGGGVGADVEPLPHELHVDVPQHRLRRRQRRRRHAVGEVLERVAAPGGGIVGVARRDRGDQRGEEPPP
jgi:hypothetical protein